jgi:hypothetical protein
MMRCSIREIRVIRDPKRIRVFGVFRGSNLVAASRAWYFVVHKSVAMPRKLICFDASGSPDKRYLLSDNRPGKTRGFAISPLFY